MGIDGRLRKTHLTRMGIEITISSKGQIVIPKDVRARLKLRPGQKLTVSESGGAVVLRPARPEQPKISYEEFRRRVPRYEGPPATIEEMDEAVARMFKERGRP